MPTDSAAGKPLHPIWDFDGTLYDAYPRMAGDLCAALSTFGIAGERSEIYRMIKRTLYHGITTLAARHGLETDALLAAFRRLHTAPPSLPLMAGAAQCLARTAQLGCRHYLFTHRDNAALAMLQADGLAPYFTDAVTREMGFADKPSPEAIVHLMRKHGFAPAHAYMIGDRDIDILSGQAAGAAGILFDPEGFYPDLPCAHRVAMLADVTALVERRLATGV